MSSAQDLPDDAHGGTNGATGDPYGVPAEAGDLGPALARLSAVIEREHERAAHREAIIDRLHEENQSLRRGELTKMFEPVRSALYRLHDLTRREAERWAAPQPPEPAHVAPLLTAVADELAEALARTGVERFTVKPGDPFDPARHRPVGTTPAADPALDGTVAAVRADGFEQGEQVVRRAEVVVAKLTRGDMR